MHDIIIYEKLNIDKVNKINIITLSKLISLTLNKIISEYIKNLLKDFINFFFISQYLNFINNYKNNAKLKYLLVTSPEFDLDSAF